MQTNERISYKPQKIYGTTLYIGVVDLETRFGLFKAYTFQDLIHKGYIIALSFGDLKSETLYTRIHSSCVTSETLRSMDCDCVHQLEGAMQKISEQGHGVLFYLIQEGRGCGYIGKSRACMLVQYHNDEITTFDAYKQLGMKDDYRDYRSIKEVAYLLGIEENNYYLLTNNPDKIKGFQEIGLNLKGVESIEVAPSPFNQSYLVSKERFGHLLYKTKTKISKYNFSLSRVKPFDPYPLASSARFIHCAKYYIPIKPVDNQMEFDASSLDDFRAKGIQYNELRKNNGGSLIQIEDDDIDKVQVSPYWFQVNMYYDIASHSDYIVLAYGDIEKTTPLVRVHSESLFNRFPLKVMNYKEKYKRSLQEIVKNNSGLIVLFCIMMGEEPGLVIMF